MTKIAIITDIHANAQHGTKRGNKAFALLEQVLQKINDLQPDLLIDLGDRINDTNPATDAMVLEALHHLFCNSEIPRVHLLGNHNLRFLAWTFGKSNCLGGLYTIG